MKAFSYLRVSGKTQLDGDGFPRQRAAIENYARSNAIEIAEEFRDEGVSGTKELDGRPALGALFVALEENGVKTVVCEKLDRLARDLMVQEAIIADAQKRGFTILSTCEPDLCSSDPSRVLIRQIFGALAQYDRAMIVLKLRAAKERLKAQGKRVDGRKPYGINAAEKENVEYMRKLRSSGLKYHAICKDLNLHGILARNGKPWTVGAVHKIVTRQP